MISRMAVVALVSVFPVLGASCTLSTSYASLAASSGHYGGGCGALPVAGDTLTTSSAAVLTIANGERLPASGSLGSNSSNVGIGLHLTGSSGVTVATGGTLSTAGNDISTNAAVAIDVGSNISGTGTWITDNSGDYTSVALNSGTINFSGTLTVPASYYSWSNQNTATNVFATNQWWGATPTHTQIYITLLSNAFAPVSNAAGTGIGSFGDSSLSFTSSTPAGAFATEVATRAALTTAGQYYVDYYTGSVYSVTVTSAAAATWKYHTFSQRGWGIINQSGATFTCNGCTLDHMGKYGSPFIGSFAYGAAVELKTGATATFTSPVCQWGWRCLLWSGDPNGSAGSPVKVTGATVSELKDNAGYMVMSAYNTPVTYLQILNPVVNSAVSAVFGLTGTSSPSSHLLIQGATGTVDSLYNGGGNACSDCLLTGSVTSGHGQLGTNTAANFVTSVAGTAGHPMVVSNNTTTSEARFGAYGNQAQFLNNRIMFSPHHGIVPGTQSNVYAGGLVVRGNVFEEGTRTVSLGVGGVQTGYVNPAWVDKAMACNNTWVGGGGGNEPWIIGDTIDSGVTALDTWTSFCNNLTVAAGSTGTLGTLLDATASGTTTAVNAGMALLGHNAYYNVATPYTGYTTDAVFTRAGANYNDFATVKNATGVTVSFPSYVSATTGAVRLVVTSNQNVTAAWSADNGSNYGTPKQIVQGGAGTSYAIATVASIGGTAYNITVTGTPWSTTQGNATNPLANFAVMLTGASAGAVGAVTSQASTSGITMTFPATQALAATDTFELILGAVTLSDAASGTVSVTVDPRYMPTSAATYTDTGIVISFPSVTATNPYLLSTNYDDPAATVQPMNPALFTAGVGGILPGASANLVQTTVQ